MGNRRGKGKLVMMMALMIVLMIIVLMMIALTIRMTTMIRSIEHWLSRGE